MGPFPLSFSCIDGLDNGGTSQVALSRTRDVLSDAFRVRRANNREDERRRARSSSHRAHGSAHVVRAALLTLRF